MGRRATDLATPVPVLGVPALIGLRGYKTLAGEKIAGPPPLPALSWTQQCSIGVQTSPGVGRLPLLQPGAKQPASTLLTASPDTGIDAPDCFVAKELKEEGILQHTQGDRHQQRCVEAKTRKEVTFQEIPAGTSEHREGSQGHNKVDCYARAIKTNPHLAGTLTKGGPKPKLCLRYTNGSVVDSDAIGGISVEGGDARPGKDSAPGREQGKPVGGHCVEQSGEGASVTAVQPFRTPPKICNQCGGKQTAPCGQDIMGWQKPTGACPEGVPLNAGTLPPPTIANPTTPTTAATDMGKLRDFQVCHPQLPQRMTTCMAQRPSLAGRPPLVSPNAGLKPKTPHPSCPVHSAHSIPQGYPVASAQPQTPTQLPSVLPAKALTVTEAIIETRQHDANSNSLETQPHTNKPSIPACISLPPQFAIATKANTPYGCSYRKWTETSSCIAARYNVSDGGAVHTAPSSTQLPAAAREGPRSYRSSPARPENPPHIITTSSSTNALHTDCNINTYTMGLKGPSAVNDSITVKNKNMKNQACSDSSRNPSNLAKPLSKASLEMVMNTKNNAKTAMRPKTFPGSILHLATTQVMDTLSSYEQNNTSLPVGTHMHIQAPTHTALHATTIAKTTPDPVLAIKPFRRVETPRETNPSDSRTDDFPKPMSDHYRAEPMGSLCSKPFPVSPQSQIHTTSSVDVFPTSSPSKAIPLEESSSPCAVSPSASPELIEKPSSGHQSRDAPPHMSSDGGHLTHVLNLDRPSRADTAPPAQTSPGAQTHSHNGPALETAGAIHHGAPPATSQGPGGAAVRPQEPLASSEKTRLAGDIPNPSHTRKTNAQHLHRFPPNLLKNMAALTMSEECVSNHTYTVSTIRRETKVNSIIKSCFDPNKDYKCIDTPEKQNSKPHQNSIFLKVTHHLNYISRIKPQRCQSQTSVSTNKQQFFPLKGHIDRMKQVHTAPPAPQVSPSEEIQHPTTTEPCLLGCPAGSDLETGAMSEARSLCSMSPTGTPYAPRHHTAPEDATADSSFDDSTGELSRQRFLDSDTLSSQLTCTHSSASSPLSQSTLDTSDRELSPRSPTGPTCGVRLQRPWTDLTALAHLRSRVRASQSSGHTLVHQGPGGHPPQDHAHPPDAEERLLPPSPRCSKTAALQWRLEMVEASLEANRARISTLLHIIQDLEQSHASSTGCWCFRTGQDLKNCSICQRTACVVYSVEYDFRQQEKCFSVLLDHSSSEPPSHATSSPFHQAHSITSLRDALARRIARSRVKSKKLCKTFFKLLPRKSQQR